MLTHLAEPGLGLLKFACHRGLRRPHLGQLGVEMSQVANIALEFRAHLTVRRLQKADSADEILASALKYGAVHRHGFGLACTLLAVRLDDLYLSLKIRLLLVEV